MSRYQFPFEVCTVLTIVLEGGHVIHQHVWDWKVLRDAGDAVTDISYTWAGEHNKFRVVKASSIIAVATMPGPLRWRGWRK